MARKSRSKQRSKGAGTRSGSAGGKSQGGGRSSAGGGKSQGGSGKSGGSKSGGSKSGGSKGGSSKSSRSTKTSSPSTKTPTKTYSRPATTVAQQRFRDREAAGLSGLTGGPKGESISQYRARQKEGVQNAALGRQATFKTGIPSGANLKAGSFGISAAGKAQAEANRKAAQEAAKKEATRKNAFDPNRLSSSFTNSAFNQYMQAGGINNINTNVFNNPNNYLNKGLNTSFQNESKIPFGSPRSYFQKYPNPNSLFGNDALQVGKSDQNYLAGKRGNPFGRPDQAFNIFRPADKGGPGSGPTPLTRETIKRFGPGALRAASSFLPGYSIGSKLFNEGKTDSALSKSLSNVENINAGGLSIGFNSPESTDIGARAGRFFQSIPGRVVNAFTGGDETKVASTDAGGLNIGGGVDSEGGSDTGRTVVSTDRDKNINYDVGGIAKDVGLGLADFATFNKFDFDNLGRPSDNKTVDQQIATFKKSPLQQAILSKQLGIDANRMITEGGAASDEMMKRYFSQVTTEGSAKDARNPIARFLKDVGDTPATQMAGRAQDAFKYNDPNFSDDPNKLTKFLSSVSGIPNLSEENVQDIRHTFNTNVTAPTGIEGKSMLKNVPYNQALGFANRIPSGMLKDAMVETMDTQGLTKFNSVDDVVNVGSQMFDSKTQGPVAKQKLGDLQNLVNKYGPGKGQLPTIPSIIKGIGGVVGRSGGSGSPMQIQGGSGMTATLPTAVPQQQQLPLPLITQQTGVGAGNLQNIQQNAYNNQMSMYGTNPNYFAQFRPQQRFPRRGRFRSAFSRDYFN